MKVAVFGSDRSDSSPRMKKRAEFRPFCRDLGAALAAIPHVQLRVASDAEHTADYWVVRGFADALAAPYTPRVVIYPRDNKEPFRDLRKRKPGLFTDAQVQAATRAVAAHLRMLRGADAALLVGGKNGVVNAGLAAILTRARVWPVPYFGGGTAQFLQSADSHIAHQTPARIPDTTSIDRLSSSPAGAIDVIRTDAAAFPRVMIIHGRSTDRTAVAEMLGACGVSQVDVLVDRSRPGATIVEEFERVAAMSDAAVAVLTPEDLLVDTVRADGRPSDIQEHVPRLRARQNVLLEYGWFWARLGRDRTLLLVKGEVEIPSDLYGVKVVVYENDPRERLQDLNHFVERIRTAS